jgi:hypothetical protein
MKKYKSRQIREAYNLSCRERFFVSVTTLLNLKQGVTILIEIKNLYKTYLNDKQSIEAIKGIDLKIEDGEILKYSSQTAPGKNVRVRLHRGRLICRVTEVENE